MGRDKEGGGEERKLVRSRHREEDREEESGKKGDMSVGCSATRKEGEVETGRERMVGRKVSTSQGGKEGKTGKLYPWSIYKEGGRDGYRGEHGGRGR